MSYAQFRDDFVDSGYPRPPYTFGGGIWTTDEALISSAVQYLIADGGGDLPESDLDALVDPRRWSHGRCGRRRAGRRVVLKAPRFHFRNLKLATMASAVGSQRSNCCLVAAMNATR